MKALITGADGFVGGHLARHLLDSGDEVVGAVLGSSDSLRELGVKTVVLDVTDAAACRSVIGTIVPDVIYHLAGIAFVPQAEENFEHALRVNVAGTHNVFRTAYLLDRKITVLYVSSAEVYGRVLPQELPVSEAAPIRPANNYSLSKAMGELVAKRHEREGGLLTSVVMRPFNHIGPGQDERFVASSFARQLAQIAAGAAAPVLKVGNLDAARDFTDVRDIVRAYRLAAVRGESGIFNLASEKPVKISALLDGLIAAAGIKVELQTDPARLRSAEVPVLYGSAQRASRELGWRPEIPLERTLRDIYEAWRAAPVSLRP